MVGIFIIIILLFTVIIYNIFQKNNNSTKEKIKSNSNEEIEKNYNDIYKCKCFMTDSELEFYNKISSLENEYHIVPQLALGSIIGINNNQNWYINFLHKYIDFAIFNKSYTKLLLLIELNDSSHNYPDRIERDKKVRKLCNDLGIKLITFYTKYSNEQEYVIERIKNEIEKE